MKHPARNKTYLRESTSGYRRLRFMRHAPLSGLLWALAFPFAFSSPALACSEPPVCTPAALTIVFNTATDVTITIEDYVTFGGGVGNFCACGLKLTASMVSIDSATIVNSATQVPIPGFSFSTNTTTSSDLATAGGGGTWQGFFSSVTQAIPAGTIVDIIFGVTVTGGTTFAGLQAELEAAGNTVGTDEAAAGGGLANTHLCIISSTVPTPPSCALTGVNPGPPTTLTITAQDSDDGLASISVFSSSNATANIPAFTVGTTSPVVFTASKVDDSLPAFIEFQVCDTDGTCTICDPVITTLVITDGEAVRQTFTGIPPQERFVKIENARRGLSSLEILVNGASFAIWGMRGAQVMDLDLAGAMTLEENTVTLIARGRPRTSALVLISDISDATSEQLALDWMKADLAYGKNPIWGRLEH